MAILDGELVDIAELRGRVAALTEVAEVEVREVGGRLTAIVVPHEVDVDRVHLSRRIQDAAGAPLAVTVAAELPLVRTGIPASAARP